MKYILIFLVVLVPSSAKANYYCSGKVVHLGTSTASLYVNNGSGVHLLCKLSDDACKAWLSTATTAKITGKTISIYYSSTTIGGNQQNDACKAIGSWVTPSDRVYYLQLN